jgi:hypothetical protein
MTIFRGVGWGWVVKNSISGNCAVETLFFTRIVELYIAFVIFSDAVHVAEWFNGCVSSMCIGELGSGPGLCSSLCLSSLLLSV